MTESEKDIYERASLEKEIKECALKFLPEAKEKLKTIKKDVPFIGFPFYCKDTFYSLVYDTGKKSFTKIIFNHGIDNNVYFDSIAFKEVNDD